MKTQTASKIIDFVQKNGNVRPVDLVRTLDISPVAVHKQLRGLVEKNLLIKQGTSPRVYYSLPVSRPSFSDDVIIPTVQKRVIDLTYLSISPQGTLREGYEGFTQWVKEIGETNRLVALADEYVQIRKEADRQYINGVIDATEKVKKTFPTCFLDRLLYQDFYSLPKFGKTKLGSLVLYAKQSQNRMLIKRIAEETKETILDCINSFHIQAVAFIPPTIPRILQFQKEYAHILALPIPEFSLKKVRQGTVIVAQKTLPRLEERVANAKATIYVEPIPIKYSTVLLIDDAAGSGATINETAKKIKEAGIAKKVIGFTVVGSYKGFDIIQET